MQEDRFRELFEKEVQANPQKTEYFISAFIMELLEKKKIDVKYLKLTTPGTGWHEDVKVEIQLMKKVCNKYQNINIQVFKHANDKKECIINFINNLEKVYGEKRY